MNFDNRSMSFNDETTLLAVDSDLGARMEQLFDRDLRDAREITLEAHRSRPLTGRLLDHGATLLSRVL